jgi:hypothetical protein
MLTSTRRSISYPNTDRSDRPDIPAHILNLINALELDVIYVQGTAAARGAAVHMAGVIWRETDTGLFYWDNGATWNPLGMIQSDVNKIGTDAARLASATLPAGTLWATTDTYKVYRTDGLGNASTNWTLVAGSGGVEFDSVAITANVTTTNTSEGTSTAVLTGNSVTYDGAKVRIEVMIEEATNSGTTVYPIFVCYRDAVVIGQFHGFSQAKNAITMGGPITFFDTPTAAAHVYKIAVYGSGAGTVTVTAGAGGSGAKIPCTMRVSKA